MAAIHVIVYTFNGELSFVIAIASIVSNFKYKNMLINILSSCTGKNELHSVAQTLIVSFIAANHLISHDNKDFYNICTLGGNNVAGEIPSFMTSSCKISQRIL